MNSESLITSLNLGYWLLQSIAMVITCALIPKLKITNPLGALAAVVCLAFVNSHIWDAALFFHIPSNITSQALTLLVANGLVFWVVVKLLPGIEVEGFLAPLAAPVVFTICSILIAEYGKDIDWQKLYDSFMQFIQTERDILKQTVGTPAPRHR